MLKINNSGKTHIIGSKSNTKVNNEKPKHILTTAAKTQTFPPIQNKLYPTKH